MEYKLSESDHSRAKAELTRAIRSGDPNKVYLAVRRARAMFDRLGYPDDWTRWQRAEDDAKMKQMSYFSQPLAW